MQRILETAEAARARKRTYDHNLKGSLFCGACGSRLQLDLPKNKQGIRYAYFACTGRRKRTTGCTRRAIPVAVAERLVVDCYAGISISGTQYADIDRRIDNKHHQRYGTRRPIDKALRLLIDCQRLYKATDPHVKRLANQTFTNSIDINEDQEATIRIAESFAATTLMSGCREF